MQKNRQLVLNMAASLLSTMVSLGISFFITPRVIGKLGAEAQGFVTMATNFVNYAAIAAMALNSMAGRFITVRIAQGDDEGANKYFNSVMYANIAIVAALILPFALVVVYLEKLVNISPALTGDVKLLFAFMFVNFCITIVATTFSTATFAANRLDLQALRTIESQVLKAVTLILLFAFLPVRVSFIGFATLLSNIYLFITYIHYTKKLLPDIKVNRSYFSMQSVMEILSAGVWNTVMRTGQVLTNQLDTLITNLWIGKDEGGYIGTSTTIVTAVNTLYETVSAVFTPSLTISFAKDDRETLIDDLKSAMRLTGFFANIPLCYIIGFGYSFYTLWLPTETDIIYIYWRLTVLIMLGTLVGGAISPLFNVYTIVNKLKWNSIVTLIMGVANALGVFILLQFEPLRPYGIYFVAGLSSVLGIIKNMTFTPMYAAHCLKLPKKTFYPTILRYIAVTCLMSILFGVMGKLFPAHSWLQIFISVVVCGMLGSIMNFVLLFEKKERETFITVAGRFIGRKPGNDQ